ncbi:MAG: cytochrome c biogenesis protein CcdA [Candidatus Thorarchaeota archaeon]|nr:cytochrome c biogenesis protein CcdA [Candidatus Thorarchaeota archaeon]
MLIQQFVEVAIQLGTMFSMGFYVAISPCLFPLLPLFLIRNLQSETSRSKSVLVTGVLILGILSSLAVFAVIASFIGLFIISYYTYIQAVLGGIIVFLGVVTISHKLRDALRLTRLSMSDPGSPTSLVGVFGVGFSYSLLAAPCTAPVLFALPLIFSAQSNFFVVIMMYLILCIGVSIPYLAIALVTGEARERMANRLANSARIVELIVGTLLIVLGILLILPAFGIVIL